MGGRVQNPFWGEGFDGVFSPPFFSLGLVGLENPCFFVVFLAFSKNWKKGKDPHPQDKIQHLDFTKDPGPLYYKTPPCVFHHKNVRSKAVFGP